VWRPIRNSGADRLGGPQERFLDHIARVVGGPGQPPGQPVEPLVVGVKQQGYPVRGVPFDSLAAVLAQGTRRTLVCRHRRSQRLARHS